MTKEDKYEELLPQLAHILADESDPIAQMAQFCAAIRTMFGFYWIGFYRVQNTQLVLGPFQGTLACTRIEKGKGVCGTAWVKGETIIVPDVDLFEGHIACSTASRSEIVVPIIRDNTVVAVLDIDSDTYNTFDEIDRLYLEKAVKILQI